MKYLSYALIPAFLLFGCSGQKELKKSNADLEAANKNLTQTNRELSDRVQRLETELGKATEGNQAMNTAFTRYKDDCEQTRQELAGMHSVLQEISETFEA